MLDIFQDDQAEALASANRRMAPQLPQTFGETFLPAWNEGLLFGQSVSRSNARSKAMLDYIDDVYRQTGVSLPNPEFAPLGQDGLGEFNAQLEKLATQHPQLNRMRHADGGQSFKPFTDEEIDDLAARASARARIDYKYIQAQEKTFGGAVGGFAGSAAAGIVDPVNLLAFPLAAPTSLGILGTTAAWAGIAGGTQAAIEVAGGSFRERVEPGHTASGEPLQNILGAATFGGVLGGGLKAAGAAWTRVKTGEWPRTVRDAGNVVESEAAVANTNPFVGAEGEQAHRTALQRSIDSLVTGRPADLDGVVTPSILAGYEGRLAPVLEARTKAVTAGERGMALEREASRLPPTMERLSELQLDEIRQTKARIERDAEARSQALGQEEAGFTAERESLAGRRSALEGQGAETQALREELTTAQRRLAEARPPTDPITQGRLEQIEAELRRPNLGGDARALLEGERASITETLAKTSPADRKLIGSLQQEVRGLEKALARAEKTAARGAAYVTRREARIAAGERRVSTTKELTASRLTSQSEVVRGEMRKAVSALADEGYGVRLARTDAEAIADRILAASDQDADTVLRSVTDDLVRAREASRQAQGIREPTAAREGRVSEYWTDQARKRVTALAREVGHEMPREDAAAIAARIIAAKSDNEALAILDELMLRPRTLADTLPGISREAPVVRAEPDGPHVAAQDAALAPELTPARAREIRAEPETDDAVLVDLDRLRASKAKVEVPHEQVDASGQKVAIMRDVDDLLSEADARLKASQEIAACATPQLEAAE